MSTGRQRRSAEEAHLARAGKTTKPFASVAAVSCSDSAPCPSTEKSFQLCLISRPTSGSPRTSTNCRRHAGTVTVRTGNKRRHAKAIRIAKLDRFDKAGRWMRLARNQCKTP